MTKDQLLKRLDGLRKNLHDADVHALTCSYALPGQAWPFLPCDCVMREAFVDLDSIRADIVDCGMIA